MSAESKPTEFAAAAGISASYASDILKGKRAPSAKKAIQIYRRTGRRFGILTGAADDEIARIEKLFPEAM